MPASPGLGPAQRRISAAAQWLGPAVALRDASISAGLIWFVALLAALGAGAATFGFAVTGIAMLAAWQAAGAPRGSPNGDAACAARLLPVSYRAPAGVLAGALGSAAVLDTRLAGAVVVAAIAANLLVAIALRLQPSTGPAQAASAASRVHQADSADRAPPAVAADPTSPAASAVGGVPQPVLVRARWLMCTWLQVGTAAACAAAVARYSLGAALVLVCAAGAYDAGAHLSAAGRPLGLRGPLAGAVAAAIAIFALTGLSVPPFAPDDAVKFGAIAVLTLPLGPAIARPITALASRPAPRGGDGWDRPVSASSSRRRDAWQRMIGEWAVRRLDSLSVTALAWMWGLGLVPI
ncbi:hypothetical protein [Candidatus Poriferisodalis sp.]|uniref:hypothetical protein n=1 Tax=Candidatus Poriferisodalis sp. TaxID=3101277 RepID=UPI003B011455